MSVQIFYLIFCLFVVSYAKSNEETCAAYKTHQFYNSLPVQLNGYCKYSSELCHGVFKYDNVNLINQCPSFLYDDEEIETTTPLLYEKTAEKNNVLNYTESKKDAEQPPISTFEEWTKQKLEQEKQKKIQTANGVNSGENGSKEHATPLPIVDKHTNSVTPNDDGQKKDDVLKSTPLPEIIPMSTNKRNYASKECGAKVISSNKEAENKGAVLNDDGDEYLRNPCEYAQDKYLVVELCETIQITAVDLVDFEFFSSHVKDFRLLASPNFPTSEWSNLGEFNAKDTRGVQTFSLPEHNLHAKFLRLELLSHHGKEYYCTLSTLRVYGISMVDEYEAEANSIEIEVPIQQPVIKNEPEKDEENTTTESAEMDVVVPEVVEISMSSVDTVIEPMVEQPMTDIIHTNWNIEDCFKCIIGKQRLTVDWFCSVLFYHHQQKINLVHVNRTFFRTVGQVKFLKNILKPLPMCPKTATLSGLSNDNNNSKPKMDKVDNKIGTDNEIKAKIKVVKAKETPPVVPLPAGSTSHKESVFLKLNKRLSALELNISLSSEYLSELSRRYVAQVEENKRENEKNMKLAEEKIIKETKNLKKQFYEQIYDIREELKFLTNAIKSRSSTSFVSPNWRKETAEDFYSLAVRQNDENTCDEEDYSDVYLDSSDGLWTTNQLLIILSVMQVSTMLAICAMFYFCKRVPVKAERVVLVSSDYDVKQILKDEIQKQIDEISGLKTCKVENKILENNIEEQLQNPSKRKKKKKKNNINQLDLPDKWDSTSVSSNFSSISTHTNDHDTASTTSSDLTKKGSLISGDSCFASNSSENIPPLNDKKLQ